MWCRYLLLLAVLMGCSGGEELLFEDDPNNPDIPYKKLTLNYVLSSIDGYALPITVDSTFCDDGTVARDRLTRVSFEPEKTHSDPRKPDLLAVRTDISGRTCTGSGITVITYRGTYVAREDSIFLTWPNVEVVKSGVWEGNAYMTFQAEVDISGIKGLGTFRR